MKVERVTATVNYSQRKGGCKAIVLGAEATVDARDNWQQVSTSFTVN